MKELNCVDADDTLNAVVALFGTIEAVGGLLFVYNVGRTVARVALQPELPLRPAAPPLSR